MMTTTTKLDAINIMLSAIGSDPVDSVENSTDIDVANALRILDGTSRQIQRQGWDFNRGIYTFYPNEEDHKILWDKSIIEFKPNDGKTYSKRGDYLFNNDDDTYEFTDKVELRVTVALDFEDLPDTFKNYVANKAALDFQMRYMPDPSVSPALAQAVQEAHADLVQYDLNMASPNNYLQFSNVAQVMQRT